MGPVSALPSPMIERYFVCVGAQKAGTTWLARTLARHPDLFVTPVKEIHYFDHLQGITRHLSGARRWSRYRKYHQHLWTEWSRFGQNRQHWDWYRRYLASPMDDAWYASLFAERSGKRFAGEATPEYAVIGENGFRHLKRLAPEARVIFILRNPVRQAWSQVLHRCRSRRVRAERLSESELAAMADAPELARLRDFASTLDDLAAVFQSSQLLILFYEDIHADRLGALERICRFIGADFDAAWFGEADEAHNRSQDASAPDAVLKHLQAGAAATIEAVRARLGRVPAGWDGRVPRPAG